mgnify:FL=1
MKYLLVLAVVMVAFWVWRNNRQVDRADARRQAPAPAPRTPLVMVACRTCGTHLAQDEAVPGRLGLYSSDEHRQQLEGPTT